MGAVSLSLIPRDDQSEYEVTVTTPEGYSLDRTSRLLAEMEARLKKLKGTVHLFTTIGQTSGGRVVKGQGDVTRGTIYVRMTELEDRDYTQFAIQQEARELLKDYPDLRASVNDVSPFQGGRRPQTFQVNLYGPDLAKLSDYANRLVGQLKQEPGLVDLDTTLSLRKPEVQVIVDREASERPGHPGRRRRRHPPDPGRRHAGDEVPRRRRAVRRLAPRRALATGRRPPACTS